MSLAISPPSGGRVLGCAFGRSHFPSPQHLLTWMTRKSPPLENKRNPGHSKMGQRNCWKWCFSLSWLDKKHLNIVAILPQTLQQKFDGYPTGFTANDAAALIEPPSTVVALRDMLRYLHVINCYSRVVDHDVGLDRFGSFPKNRIRPRV